MNKPADIFFLIAAGAFTTWRIVQFCRSHETTFILSALYGAIVCYYIAVRKPPTTIDRSPGSTIVMLIHIVLPFFVHASNAVAFRLTGWTLCVAGTAGAAWCLTELGSSFGLLPANRGIVASGAYRWVRHPLYFCYLIALAGMVLGSGLSLSNLSIFFAYTIVTSTRIAYEERVLRKDPDYASYCQVTKHRLLPLIF